MAVVAASTACTSFNCFESLQEWPELRETISQHGYNIKPSYLESVLPIVDFNDNTLSTALKGFEYLRCTCSFHDSYKAVGKSNTYNILKKETVLISEAVASEGVGLGYVSQSDRPSDETHLDTFSNIAVPLKCQTDDEQHTKRLNGQQKKTRKRKTNKVRIKSEKRWRTLDISEFGFHISRFPKMFIPSEFLGESSCEQVVSGQLESDNSNTSIEIVANADTLISVKIDNIDDDVSFFRNSGIDVTCDSAEINISKLPDPLSQAEHSFNGVKSFFSKQYSFNLELDDLFYPTVNINSYRKKCNKFWLYDLECASSSKVYIRPDRQRRVEKAHRAVKSKNCKSLYNNKGRKTLYMHHRLVKLHNLDFDFRNTLKSQRIPAMTSKNIDVHAAKQVCKALTIGSNFLGDIAPPVQSLKHALHETNAPTQMEMDLATFLITLQHRDLTPEDYDMLLRLDDSVKPKTVSSNILGRLKTEVVGPNGLDYDDETLPLCTVCMEPYIAGQERKFLPCSHYFHSSCIDAWLKNSSMNCPLDGLPVENS